MTDKSAFTPEEWAVLRDAPHLVSFAVTTSGASGIIGTMKEAFASSAALIQGMKSENDLVRAICSPEEVKAAQQALRGSLGQFQSSDFEAAQEKIAAMALDAVRSAMETLRRKGAPGDAEAYAAFVKSLAERVALAAKEGDILGFGGERVSEGERKMLGALDAALGSTTT